MGLVFGMLAWYIGSGTGNGNAYGVTAATVVLTAPFIWARLNLGHDWMYLPTLSA